MIIRPGQRRRFLVVDKATIEDPRLSLRAKGLLAYVLCKPDDWTIDSTKLADDVEEGRDAVRTAMKQLEKAGYIERRRSRGEGGRWLHETIVHERPKTDFQSPVRPAETSEDGLSGAGEPGDGKPGDKTLSTQTDQTLAPTAPKAESKAKEPAAKERPRDLHFECLILELGITDTTQLTSPARGAINKALAEIKKTGATPGDIRTRARIYRQKFPEAALTAPALAKQWPLLTPAPSRYPSATAATKEPLPECEHGVTLTHPDVKHGDGRSSMCEDCTEIRNHQRPENGDAA